MTARAIKLPSVLCCIGQLLEVSGTQRVYKLSARSGVLLFTNAAGRELYAFKPVVNSSSTERFDQAVSKDKGQVAEAMKLYRRWHSFPAVTGSLGAPPRGFMFDVGRAVHIIYRSDKWSGKEQDYIHDFKTPPVLRVNRKSQPEMLTLTGGKIRVTKEGIKG